MPPDHCCFAYDHAGAMVDKKTLADLCTRMDINARGGMGYLGNNTGNQPCAELVKDMRYSVMDDGGDAWVANQDFVNTQSRRIALISGLNIGVNQGPHRWKLCGKLAGNADSPRLGVIDACLLLGHKLQLKTDLII